MLFLLGLFVGCLFGFLVAVLCVAAAREKSEVLESTVDPKILRERLKLSPHDSMDCTTSCK